MTIKDLKSFVGALWDWAMFDGCWGNTRIRPSDVDGLVERNGLFLFIEAKAPNVRIPEGQMKTFLAAQKTGLFTILVMWGPRNTPQRILVMTRHGNTNFPRADVRLARRIVAAWFRHADRQKPRAASA